MNEHDPQHFKAQQHTSDMVQLPILQVWLVLQIRQTGRQACRWKPSGMGIGVARQYQYWHGICIHKLVS